MTIRTDSRIRSTPSPVRNASSNSDTADWGRAIGGDSFNGEYLAVHTEDHADGPPTPGAAPLLPNPTTQRDPYCLARVIRAATITGSWRDRAYGQEQSPCA